MFYNYLKIAIRQLLKHKTFSIINALGLAIGMACCFMIVLFLQHEFQYDQFHEKADQIYRVNYHAAFGGNDRDFAAIPPPIAPLMPDYFPEVETVARLFPRSLSVSIKEGQNEAITKMEIEDFYFADSTILDIFSFEFLQGNPQSALDKPSSVVITDELAQQLFGTADALGKTIHFLDQHPFEVTGVIKPFPSASHIEFSMLAPYNNMFNIAPESAREFMQNNLKSNWIISHSYTFVLLKEGASAASVNTAFGPFLAQYGNPKFREDQAFSLTPLLDIHLHSTASIEPTPPANLNYLYIFLVIGLLTLLIACINFVNFSTASSLTRAKEVGVRKVLGAGKSTIAWQFLGESLLISFIAFLFSLFLIQIGLPYLNALTDRTLTFNVTDNWNLLVVFFGIFLSAGILAGSYPAFFVTRFKPVSILRGKGSTGVPKGALLRKILITVQFIASIALIAGTLGIYKQLDFLRNQPLGFQTNYIVNVPLFSPSLNSIFGGVDGPLRQKMNSFEETLLTHPNIERSTLSAGRLGLGSIRRNVISEKIQVEDNLFLACTSVDYDFLETYDLELLAGRAFDKSFGTDHQDAYIINEQAIHLLQMDSPEAAIGKPLTREGKVGKVIGVVKDFNYESLRNEIDGFVMDVDAAVFTIFSIKIGSSNVSESLAFIEKQWNEFFPQKVFEYTFLDESIADLYSEEDQLAKMIGYFSLLAILISCFGLYGLVAYAAVQKTKEIGIRKVLGASIPGILTLLSKEFIALILIAGAVSLPVAWLGLQYWMADYPYNVGIGWWLVVLPLIVVLSIALVTISYQTIRAAMANPVESLRCE